MSRLRRQAAEAAEAADAGPRGGRPRPRPCVARGLSEVCK